MKTETIKITREQLIEVLVEHCMKHWDDDLQEEAIRYGCTGFQEMANNDLEDYATAELSWPGEQKVYRIIEKDGER